MISVYLFILFINMRALERALWCGVWENWKRGKKKRHGNINKWQTSRKWSKRLDYVHTVYYTVLRKTMINTTSSQNYQWKLGSRIMEILEKCW